MTAVFTAGTAETSKTLKVPGGSRIKEFLVINVTGTGIVYKCRFEFTGMKTPQTYGVPNQAALQGTEVGSGTILAQPVKTDIPVPGNVSEITIYLTSDTASQSAYVAVTWEGP